MKCSWYTCHTREFPGDSRPCPCQSSWWWLGEDQAGLGMRRKPGGLAPSRKEASRCSSVRDGPPSGPRTPPPARNHGNGPVSQSSRAYYLITRIWNRVTVTIFLPPSFLLPSMFVEQKWSSEFLPPPATQTPQADGPRETGDTKRLAESSFNNWVPGTAHLG